MELPLVITLALMLCFGIVALMLDARQRRMDRMVQIALPTPASASLFSIRRGRADSKWRWLQLLVGYRAGLAYPWRWQIVVLLGALAGFAVLYANRFLGLPPAYVLAGAVFDAIIMMRVLFGWLGRRMAARLFRQLPDVVELVTSTVRAGLPVSEALRIVAREMPEPTSGQFAIVCSEVGFGRPAEEALEAVCDRTGVTEYAIFAVALAVQTKSGGRLSETLQTLGETVRERVMLAGRAKALAGEVIFSSRALSVSPVVIGGALYLINPRLLDLLFTDPTGRLMLAYAVGSVIAGTLVIRWMINRETAL